MILDYITPENDFKTTLEKMTSLAGGAAADTERLTDMHEYMETLAIEEHFILDPSITRGLDYYTGVVFETFLTDLPAIGSVCSGGRYNNLASLYTNEELPGVGSSIGLDRLMAALESLKKGKPEPLTHHVIILCMDKSYTGRYHELARRFRNEGITAEVFPEDKKIAAQFNFAEKKKIPFAVICGEDEFKSETITIKQLLTRENHEKISFSRAIGIVKSAVT
ncbi:MAG: hypothetical protein E4H36_01950 [Spirochaetales bacterium]|nr:MAG: hypothetical protein E4H36_01950 [Spirochaetales bacterium]